MTILQHITPFLNLSIVVIGWTVVFRNAQKLNARAEAHVILQKCDDLLSSIDAKSREFWHHGFTKDNKAESYIADIGAKIASLRHYQNIIVKHTKLNFNKFELANIRSLATLDAEYISSAKPGTAEKVSRSIESERSKLYEAFRRAYPLN